jgi:hypothetical protein
MRKKGFDTVSLSSLPSKEATSYPKHCSSAQGITRAIELGATTVLMQKPLDNVFGLP